MVPSSCHRRDSNTSSTTAAGDDHRTRRTATRDGGAAAAAGASGAAGESTTLRRRLEEAVETCQTLAAALLDVPQSSRTTHVETARHSAQLLNSINKMALDTENSELGAVEARLKEVEEMNARWQGYMEQREQYTQALELRCSQLEQALNNDHHHHHRPHHSQLLSEEQQRRVDQVLLEQRHKAELADDERAKAEAENRQLRARVKQLSTLQDQNKLCVDQLVSRLQESEAVRRVEQNTVEALRQQIAVYREDFEGERLDRHRAQERVVNLERQVTSLKLRLAAHETNASRTPSQRSRCWLDPVAGADDASLPLLVARGAAGGSGSEPSSFHADLSGSPYSDAAPRSC